MADQKTLFERIGGKEAVDAAVDIFYNFMLSDERTKHFFDKTDMAKQRQRQKEFLTMVMGGSNEYGGKDMKAAHEKFKIGQLEFDATWENLQKALVKLNVPENLINELKEIFYSVKDDVINTKWSSHETPLFIEVFIADLIKNQWVLLISWERDKRI